MTCLALPSVLTLAVEVVHQVSARAAVATWVGVAVVNV